jgi:hypothetical protein
MYRSRKHHCIDACIDAMMLIRKEATAALGYWNEALEPILTHDHMLALVHAVALFVLQGFFGRLSLGRGEK